MLESYFLTVFRVRKRQSLTVSRSYLFGNINKHLMTGPKGNSEFCFPETLNVPRGEASHLVFFYTFQLKTEQYTEMSENVFELGGVTMAFIF